MTYILTLDRGFVLIGNFSMMTDRPFWMHGYARVIRRWGTTKGLAELQFGPLPETVLDEIAFEEVPYRAIIKITHADEKKWQKHLLLSDTKK